MIYTACRYAPVELFAGFDEECQRLDPSPLSFACSEACAHPNLCGFAKSIIEEVKEKNIRELVLTDCCDATRRVYDVLRDDLDFIWLLALPHKNGEAELKLFEADLIRLKDAYSAYSHKSFNTQKAIAAWKAGYEHRAPRPQGEYVRVAGAHASKRLIDAVEEQFQGVLPVVNDTCTGTRSLFYEETDEAHFFDRYAASLLSQPYQCMRMWYNGGRVPPDARNVKGTIMHTIKFCDYYGFEYMEEKKHADGIILKLETDGSMQSAGQLKTRLEAFKEELGVKGNEVKAMKTDGPVITAGIDSGSTSTDAVIMNQNREILGSAIVATGAGAANASELALNKALEEAGLKKEDLTAIVTTGYGRETTGVEGTSVTEITCHARGANYLNPEASTVIDIGGQDSKVILIDEKGNVKNFIMNDKCAAGTGRFLEMQARALGMTMQEMSEKGLAWKNDLTISSMCTVFAESEVVSLVAENKAPEDIIHGLNNSVAAKTAALVTRLGGKEKYIMTGGVANNKGVLECLKEKLKADISVYPESQLCGSIGAALIALEELER